MPPCARQAAGKGKAEKSKLRAEQALAGAERARDAAKEEAVGLRGRLESLEGSMSKLKAEGEREGREKKRDAKKQEDDHKAKVKGLEESKAKLKAEMASLLEEKEGLVGEKGRLEDEQVRLLDANAQFGQRIAALRDNGYGAAEPPPGDALPAELPSAAGPEAELPMAPPTMPEPLPEPLAVGLGLGVGADGAFGREEGGYEAGGEEGDDGHGASAMATTPLEEGLHVTSAMEISPMLHLPDARLDETLDNETLESLDHSLPAALKSDAHVHGGHMFDHSLSRSNSFVSEGEGSEGTATTTATATTGGPVDERGLSELCFHPKPNEACAAQFVEPEAALVPGDYLPVGFLTNCASPKPSPSRKVADGLVSREKDAFPKERRFTYPPGVSRNGSMLEGV